MVFHNEAQKLNPQSKTQSVGVLRGWRRSTQNLKTGLNSKIWKWLYMPFMVSFAAKVCTRFEKQKFGVLDASHQEVQLREISLFLFGPRRYTLAKQRAGFLFNKCKFRLPASVGSFHSQNTNENFVDDLSFVQNTMTSFYHTAMTR